uniref:Uncharacterized protein n=1 Tax=Meloidogyne enterolobii TaxID=390850 RepID=A0A6V7WRA1_MELEN|nr:unnamed protein product [Meloidogyne enterolobii]
MKEDTSSDSDYELIQSKCDLGQENEIENKNVVEKPKNQINVEELKVTFQQMIDEIKIENSKQNSMEESTCKKFGELNVEFKQINNLANQSFVQIANKWKEIKEKCCEANCITTEKPTGECVKGNGFANLINDEYVEYIESEINSMGFDKSTTIYAENAFNKPKDRSNYSILYFEVKYISKINEEGINNRRIHIGLENTENNYARLQCGVYGGKEIWFNVQDDEDYFGCLRIKNILWNNNDIFGCGLVYPPSTTNDFAYIFFTHNGKQIGNPILLNENCDGYKPFVELTSCSVETNFGKDLKVNPFAYDLSKHVFHKYSDFEKDLNELIEMFPLITKEGIKQILLVKGGIKEIVSESLNYIFPKND